MPRLTALDFAMFALESRDRPVHVGPLVILKPKSRASPGFADRLLEQMLRRPVGAPFHYRLRTAGLEVPRLEVDPDADLAKHVHRLTLRAPGTDKALLAKVCELHEERLDRSRMLWELWIIDGLRDGRVAIYAKVHHGIIDGATFIKALQHWLAKSASTRTTRAMWEGLPVATRTGKAAAARPLAQRLAKLLKGASGTMLTTASVYKLIAEQGLKSLGMGKGMPLPFTKTPRVFSAAPSAKRTFAYCTLPLAEMKALGKANDGTVNDVLLTVLDVALASYLKARGVAIAKPLVVDMPIALGGAGGRNQIAVLQFPLGAPGSGPMERFAAILAQTSELKDQIRGKSGETIMMFTALVHGIPALFERLNLGKAPLLANMVVSNPFGLAEKRYLMGAEVEAMLPISTLPPGQSLNITSTNYGEDIVIAFLAMAKAVPEIETLAAQAVKAFAKLKAESRKRGRKA